MQSFDHENQTSQLKWHNYYTGVNKIVLAFHPSEMSKLHAHWFPTYFKSWCKGQNLFISEQSKNFYDYFMVVLSPNTISQQWKHDMAKSTDWTFTETEHASIHTHV